MDNVTDHFPPRLSERLFCFFVGLRLLDAPLPNWNVIHTFWLALYRKENEIWREKLGLEVTPAPPPSSGSRTIKDGRITLFNTEELYVTSWHSLYIDRHKNDARLDEHSLDRAVPIVPTIRPIRPLSFPGSGSSYVVVLLRYGRQIPIDSKSSMVRH